MAQGWWRVRVGGSVWQSLGSPLKRWHLQLFYAFLSKKKNGIFTIRQNVHIYLRRCVAIFISYQHLSGRWDITLGMCKAGVGTEAGWANYNLERKCIFFAFYTFSPVSSLCFNTSRHRHWTLWPVKWETQLTLAHLCPKFSALPYASLKTIHILYQRRLN